MINHRPVVKADGTVASRDQPTLDATRPGTNFPQLTPEQTVVVHWRVAWNLLHFQINNTEAQAEISEDDARKASRKGQELRSLVATLKQDLAAHEKAAPVPYPEFCAHPNKCAGRTTCPRDPTCAD